MTEEDGNLDGVPKVRMTDVKSVEGPRRNGVGIEDFITSSLCGQHKFERVKAFTPGSKWCDAILNMRHQ